MGWDTRPAWVLTGFCAGDLQPSRLKSSRNHDFERATSPYLSTSSRFAGFSITSPMNMSLNWAIVIDSYGLLSSRR